MSEPTPRQAADAIAAAAPGFRPRVGIVLGSGLDALAKQIVEPITLDYARIPGFPRPSVAGHAGKLTLGRLGGVRVACLQGRAHLYEGGPPARIALPVRTLKLIGCDLLLLTNAAGALRPDLTPGSLMLISDHINFMGANPLVGPNDDAVGPRFPTLDGLYDPTFRQMLRTAAKRLGLALAEGIYLACLGPNFETPAEVRAFARLGADAVGMSSVPEAIVARHCGLGVVALSVITNLAAGLGPSAHGHAETLAMAARAGGDLARLVAAFLEEFADVRR
jgi:xanthosine phosphorylase